MGVFLALDQSRRRTGGANRESSLECTGPDARAGLRTRLRKPYRSSRYLGVRGTCGEFGSPQASPDSYNGGGHSRVCCFGLLAGPGTIGRDRRRCSAALLAGVLPNVASGVASGRGFRLGCLGPRIVAGPLTTHGGKASRKRSRRRTRAKAGGRGTAAFAGVEDSPAFSVQYFEFDQLVNCGKSRAGRTNCRSVGGAVAGFAGHQWPAADSLEGGTCHGGELSRHREGALRRQASGIRGGVHRATGRRGSAHVSTIAGRERREVRDYSANQRRRVPDRSISRG